MTDSPSPRFSLAIATLLGGLLLFFGVGLVVFFANRRGIDPPTILPAKETVAYLAHMHRSDLEQFAAWYPVLQNVPKETGLMSVAVVHGNDGKLHWRLFEENDRGEVRNMQSDLPSHGEKMIDARDALSSLEAFQMLRGRSPHDGGWMFADLKTLLQGSNAALDALLRSFLAASPYALVSQSSNTFSIAVLTDGPIAETGLDPSIPFPSPPPDTIIASAAPLQQWRALSGILPQEMTMVFEGLWSARMQSVFGEETSLRYDLAPLLTHASMLFVRSTQSGAGLHFLLSGSADGKSLSAQLSLLRRRAQAMTTRVTLERRTFDRGFTSAILKSAPEGTRNVSGDRNGWRITALSGADAIGALATAQRGNDYLLSNDRAWLNDVIGQGTTTSIATFTPPMSNDPAAMLLAAGRTDGASLRRLAAAFPVVPFQSAVFPGLDHADGTFSWAVEREGAVVRLTVSW
ncbi:hypothetical protein HY285_04295 [Candidatus Peregrinibacteria bacterium]|nr:hypothetical protein [Candidatus Peregrinibacteria bacterium]MBI3816734.1 hypothetical protein [Candidatus Peregrinibacteria bacterium]